VLVVVALLLAACTGDGGAEPTERPRPLMVAASPASARADEVVALEVTGAPPREAVEIEVTSTDDEGVDWSSTLTRRADAEGRVVLVDEPMAPFTILTPVDDRPDLAYAWGEGESTFRIAVRADDRDPARTDVRRRLVAEGVTSAPTTLADDGVLATLWTPAPGSGVGSAVLVIGGSEGGLGIDRDAIALASRGVVALKLAYFGAPGLPAGLTEIPLETFVSALARLREEPGVDPERIWLVGGSRGSEAAVLVAARHPDLVAGVVATVPGSHVGCSIPDFPEPAWSEGGVPIPCDPLTPLPVTDVDGPVIATCGGDDRLWPSCLQAEALFDRLAAADRPPGDHLVSDPTAGHWVGSLTPYIWSASTRTTGDLEAGGDPLADDRVRAEAWPLLLEALGADAP
jgi:dienelactone hydrolase